MNINIKLAPAAAPSEGFWGWLLVHGTAIQTVAVVISAAAAFLVIWHNGKLNRRRATLDMIIRTFLDEREHKQYQEFAALMTQVDAATLDPLTFFEETQSNKDDRKSILQQLNTYELISLGIRRKVFDEAFYKHWFYSQFIKDFHRLKPLIRRVRSDNAARFCEFASLYDRWLRKRHPVKHPGRAKQAWWALTGQGDKLDAARAAEK